MTNIVLGSMTFGGSADIAVTEAIINTAFDCGITQIDTANMYVEGVSESFIGQIISKHPGRYRVASKVGNPAGNTSSGGPLSREAVISSVETSLQRLGVDALDLLYLHQPDRTTPFEETLQAVEELRAAGKVLRFGLSNYSSWQIEQIRNYAATNNMLAPTISQQMYNLLARRVETEYAEYAAVTGLETIAYNPLAGGMLARIFDPTVTPETGRFGQSAQGSYYRDRYWNDSQFQTVEQLSVIARDAGMTLLELAMRWLVSRPLTQGVLLGASRPEQILENYAAIMAGPLPEDLVQVCDDVTAHLLGTAPDYNR